MWSLLPFISSLAVKCHALHAHTLPVFGFISFNFELAGCRSDASIRAYTLALAAAMGLETMELSAAHRLLAIAHCQAAYRAAAAEASGVACVSLCSVCASVINTFHVAP